MIRFRLPLLSALLLGACIALTSMRVEARPDVFDATEFELLARRDGPLSGADLDKAQKKQLKAVEKSIDLLTGDSGSSELKDRVKTLQKLDKLLRKPFKDEFGAEPGANDLGSRLALEADTLTIFVEDQRDDLAGRVPATKVKPAKVQKQVDAADKALAKAGAATTIKKKTKALLAALAKLKKGEKLLTKLSSGGSGGEGLTVTIMRAEGNTTWTAAFAQAEYSASTGDLQIFASGPRSPGDTIEFTMFFNVTGVSGNGTTSIGSGAGQLQVFDTTLPIVQRLTQRYVANGTGSVTITKLDTGKPRVEGSFSFNATLEDNALFVAELSDGSFGIDEVDVR